MTPEQREQEIVALTRFERGDALSPEDLVICARYDRLRAALTVRDEDAQPTPGWEARVLHGIETHARGVPAPPRRWPRASVSLTMLVAAAVVMLWLWRRPSGPAPATLAVTTEVRPGEGAVRGRDPAVGDHLLVNISARARHVELRIYRDDRVLVLRCPGEPGCSLTPDGPRADLVVRAPGSYRAIVLASDAPLPAPRAQGLDADIAAAADSGARYQTAQAVSIF